MPSGLQMGVIDDNSPISMQVSTRVAVAGICREMLSLFRLGSTKGTSGDEICDEVVCLVTKY